MKHKKFNNDSTQITGNKLYQNTDKIYHFGKFLAKIGRMVSEEFFKSFFCSRY